MMVIIIGGSVPPTENAGWLVVVPPADGHPSTVFAGICVSCTRNCTIQAATELHSFTPRANTRMKKKS